MAHRPLQIVLGKADGFDLEKLVEVLERGLSVQVLVGGQHGIPAGMLILEDINAGLPARLPKERN